MGWSIVDFANRIKQNPGDFSFGFDFFVVVINHIALTTINETGKYYEHLF
jgi:hypothetical protein